MHIFRYVFFADWLKDADNFPFIGRCHGDGSHMTKIHRYELGWPNGMSVDFEVDRLYWVDALFDRYEFKGMFSFSCGYGIQLLIQRALQFLNV